MTRVRLVRIGGLAAIALALSVVLAVQLATRPDGTPLAFTECSWNGPVITIDTAHVAPHDLAPVRAHEEVHARQCAELGWLRYGFRNLTASGRLSLEAPGYCAGARERLRRGDDSAITRERLLDDVSAMFAGQADSASVAAALGAACPDLARNVH